MQTSLNLAVTVAVWGWATAMIFRGAFLGARGHMRPRVMLGFSTGLLTLWNALNLVDAITPRQAAVFVRGTGWVLALSLGFTALTGIRFGRSVEKVTSAFEALNDPGDEQDR